MIVATIADALADHFWRVDRGGGGKGLDPIMA